jgi:hypothetical protein
MIFISSLLPRKLAKWIRLPSGRQSMAVILQELAAIARDLPLICTISASNVTRSSNALPSACHISSIVVNPYID